MLALCSCCPLRLLGGGQKDLPAGLRGALVVHQHLDPNGWHSLLAESKFLLGLEDPLLGPSAVDAVSNGCMFINPVYSKPKLDFYTSQHPYIADTVGEPYVCNTRLQEISSVEKCVQKALGSSLKPFIPKDLTKEQYLIRLRNIFGKYLM
uniref:alpha-1,6-mannosyl-glycoprotein 6-beta-N-acetylglucosaminyltransferase n=1 Tax=Heterosigma akashiwo TaxID=2829 RepID=A0A7S3UVM7_HETAK